MPHSTTGSITLLRKVQKFVLFKWIYFLIRTYNRYIQQYSMFNMSMTGYTLLALGLNKQILFCLNLTMNVSLFSRHRPNMKDNNSGEWLDIKVFLLCIRQLQAVSSIENFYNISMKHYIRCAKVCMEANVNKVVSNKYSKLMGGSNNIYNYIDWLPFWTLCRNSEAFRTFPIKSILISFWCICINL